MNDIFVSGNALFCIKFDNNDTTLLTGIITWMYFFSALDYEELIERLTVHIILCQPLYLQ